jgi:hypothetical protein
MKQVNKKKNTKPSKCDLTKVRKSVYRQKYASVYACMHAAAHACIYVYMYVYVQFIREWICICGDKQKKTQDQTDIWDKADEHRHKRA